MPKNVGDFYCRVDKNCQKQEPKDFWTRMRLTWNRGHHLLPPTHSPAISACTTSTNLSSLDLQSSSTINKYIRNAHLEENLRRVIPELEPLHTEKLEEKEMNTNGNKKELDSSGVQLCDVPGEKRKILNQVIAAIAVSWVSMVIGYVSGYTAPAEKSLREDFNITKIQFSWISGIMPLAALFGGLLGGPLIEYLGRKWSIFITNVLLLIGWSVNYFAQEHWFLHVSRIISGTGVGIATLTLPVYLGETIQPEVRGTLGLLPTAFGNIGILTCFLMGIPFQWRGIAGIGVLLSIPFLLLIWLIPETPRWYVAKGRPDDAHKALQWLRGKENTETIKHELEDLMQSQDNSNKKSEKIGDLFSRTNVKSLLIVLGLMFFQQMSGINAIIFYTTNIFDKTGSNIDSSIQTTIVGCVNFVATFIATAVIDRLGRKALLYISSVAMIITLSILGVYFYLLDVTKMDMSHVSWLPLASFIVYVLGFSLGFGPVPWLMMGEILPAKIRGPAASVSTGFNWTCTFIVTTTFPLFSEIIGSHSVFWLFGAITIVGLVFTILFVPETRGQSLEDIERSLAGIKVRRVSSAANLKPLPSSF